ncbi:MAG: metallophosphoesterase, partial [Chloroflexota bacterium]
MTDIQPKAPLTRRDFLKLGGLLAGASLLAGSYPTVIERYWIETNSYRVAVPRLPPAFEGLKILQLSDLHYGPYMPLELFEWLVRRANALEKDIIVLTGDYVHRSTTPHPEDEIWGVLSKLQAPGGVYAVLGNHDHWGNLRRAMYWMERSGFNLRHRALALQRGGERLWLGGTGDLWEDQQTIDAIFAGAPPAECKIVLAHNPDSADQPYSSWIDLMISGHTHGGQVRLPLLGAPYLPVQNKRYTSGLIDGKRFPIFISRGIG